MKTAAERNASSGSVLFVEIRGAFACEYCKLIFFYFLFFRCNDVKNSDIKRAKTVEEDLNNYEVTHLTHKYNICPKTGKLFQEAKVKMLSAKNRRIKLRKQPNLLIQALRRNMLLQAMHSRKSCCPKRCFLRQPKLWRKMIWHKGIIQKKIYLIMIYKDIHIL